MSCKLKKIEAFDAVDIDIWYSTIFQLMSSPSSILLCKNQYRMHLLVPSLLQWGPAISNNWNGIATIIIRQSGGLNVEDTLSLSRASWALHVTRATEFLSLTAVWEVKLGGTNDLDDGNQEGGRELGGKALNFANFLSASARLPPRPLTLSLMLLLDGPMDRLLGCFVVE